MASTAEPSEGLPRPVLPELNPNIHDKSMIDLFMSMSFGRPPQILSSEPGRRQLNNMLRLMDKTVVEYMGVRAEIEHWIQGLDDPGVGAQFSHYFRAIDHLENCIGALHRTLLHLNRIRLLPAVPSVDRVPHKALRAAIGEINDLRDAIEHADERLLAAPDGATLPMVHLQDEQVSIGSDSIAYVDLARWIYQTFRLVRGLLDRPAALAGPTGES